MKLILLTTVYDTEAFFICAIVPDNVSEPQHARIDDDFFKCQLVDTFRDKFLNMMRSGYAPLAILFLLMYALKLSAQQPDTLEAKQLEEINIKSYQYNGRLKDIPAAINYVSPLRLQAFGAQSIVSAVNSTPGVRMEERSPGSYRFNIRGSILRSPFGVRNVKVYFNDIPFTDPAGHTYLNQLGYYNINSMEIIKGPGSSMYGAGTGGTILISSIKQDTTSGAHVEYAHGSYGLNNIYGGITGVKNKNVSRLGFQHQVNDGYRSHSALKRDVLAWTGDYTLSDRYHLTTTFLYGDLFYETPGALTLAEYLSDQRSSRPATPGVLSAEVSKAAIRQQLFLAGASLTQQLTSSLSNTTVAYGAFTALENPTIRNFAKAKEPHTGGRTTFSFQKIRGDKKLSINAGAELQQNFTTVNTFKNKNGEADSLQLADEIHTGQRFAFIQTIINLADWEIFAGVSINENAVEFTRNFPAPVPVFKKKFNNQVAPRFALSKKAGEFLIYASLSNGFSPPSSSELLPSGSAFNYALSAEHGYSYEVGIKGKLFRQLMIDISAFDFSLNNTIVQRRDAGGGDYFINAGRTKQRGIESAVNTSLFNNNKKIKNASAWLSHTFHDFMYKDFKQVNSDFSGNRMPAIPKNTVSAGMNVEAVNGLFGSVSYYYSSSQPLNDSNTEYADAYHIVTARAGYEFFINHLRIKCIAGGDNLLNQRYSLGNDINGFGGRYYNAAPGRNYYVAINLEMRKGF